VYEAYRSQDHYINFYLGWKGDVDWMQIYNLYFSKQKSNGYITAPFVRSMESYFKQNPLCARASIENDLFDATSKPDANVRSEMYIQYIKAGYLDKKKARKIRSESSEYASSKALIALLDLHDENPSIYPNIDDLLLQFTDTKYSSVQETLAARAPFRILYAFVGFDSRYAKSMLEQRMQNGK
jgi:hypothetical protein